mgnify:CR=1 FL=1
MNADYEKNIEDVLVNLTKRKDVLSEIDILSSERVHKYKIEIMQRRIAGRRHSEIYRKLVLKKANAIQEKAICEVGIAWINARINRFARAVYLLYRNPCLCPSSYKRLSKYRPILRLGKYRLKFGRVHSYKYKWDKKSCKYTK